MTSPIIFTPTPHDLDSDNADAEDAFGQVATVTDTNFNAVRTYFNGRAPVVATQSQVGGPATPWVGQAWTDFPTASWPSISIVVPKVPSVLLCMIGANVYNLGRPNDSWLAVSFYLTGNGLVGWAPPAQWTPYRVVTDNGAIGSSVVWPIPASYLNPSGTVDLTPMYWLNSTNVDSASLRIEYGQSAMLCFQ